jgi:hypothetical protein
MTTYEILDAIADTYTPLLFLGYLTLAIIYWRSGDRLAPAKGLAGIIAAYALMLADNDLQIWRRAGLDYSTHSAVAIVLVIFLIHKRRWNSFATIGLGANLVLYYALEVYQQYHTVMDIVTTAAIVGPVVAVIYWVFGKLSPSASSTSVAMP